MSASQSRNYDRAQDISPRQMVLLLEVTERTRASLGQALATGEHESAHTWNDHVRPSLRNGNLGSATGVWQFQPATFHIIIKKFGAQLLAASAADAATGRQPMDLGEGPFTDEQVRRLIRETADGKRGAEDGDLQLLRHNFAVLAFAKHYLSLDSGATTPEEDYLYHFLGAGQGKRVLALARGEARDTLCVKPAEAQTPSPETEPELPSEGDRVAKLIGEMKAEIARNGMPPVAAEPALAFPVGPRTLPPVSSQWGLEAKRKLAAGDGGRVSTKAEAALSAVPSAVGDLYLVLPAAADAQMLEPVPVSSQWGLPANSPTVTGNLGMFYRDGKGQTQPYTWAEFMENLARRVRAEDQPALVRAKYGVGFALEGGDLPGHAFNPETASEATEFRHENEQTVLLPEALVTGTLGEEETRQYKERLAALVRQGEDKPTDTLSPEALSALHHLKVLSPDVQDVSTANPQVQKALQSFRKMVGKAEPDNRAHINLLMPAERIALEIYEQRLARYAALQAGQQASSGDAPDLKRIGKMPAGLRKSAAPHIAVLQRALAAQGLLTQPTKKSVWRDKKRRKHVTYKTLPFAGKADKATVAALDTFQWRNGLRRTQGVLDAVTLQMLSLPPMGPEIFLPLSGPRCAIDGNVGMAPMCELPDIRRPSDFAGLTPTRRRAIPELSDPISEPDCLRYPGGRS